MRPSTKISVGSVGGLDEAVVGVAISDRANSSCGGASSDLETIGVTDKPSLVGLGSVAETNAGGQGAVTASLTSGDDTAGNNDPGGNALAVAGVEAERTAAASNGMLNFSPLPFI